MVEPAKLKRNLTRIFLRRGVEGSYTATIDSMSPSRRAALESHCSLTDEELPVIGGYKDEKEWLVITTKKIAWCFDGTHYCIPVSSVVFATIDFDAMQEKRLTMDKVNEILITTKDQGVIPLRMEAGGPMCGVWNVLLHISHQNASINVDKT
jgi:hypothetical protein